MHLIFSIISANLHQIASGSFSGYYIAYIFFIINIFTGIESLLYKATFPLNFFIFLSFLLCHFFTDTFFFFFLFDFLSYLNRPKPKNAKMLKYHRRKNNIQINKHRKSRSAFLYLREKRIRAFNHGAVILLWLQLFWIKICSLEKKSRNWH